MLVSSECALRCKQMFALDLSLNLILIKIVSIFHQINWFVGQTDFILTQSSIEWVTMTKNQNKMELAEKTAGSNYTLNNGFLGGKQVSSW